MTVEIKYVFKTKNDKIIGDVGKKTYPQKNKKGRKKKIRTLRKGEGLEGKTKRSESENDPFGGANS